MGPINQPEVKIDDNDYKKNNEIIEKKKKEYALGFICVWYICLWNVLEVGSMKRKKRNKYSDVLLFFMVYFRYN